MRDVFGGIFPEHFPEYLVQRAGQALGFVLVLCDIKADWPAWNMISGCRSWSHKLYPCSLCNVRRDDMKKLTLGDHVYDHDDYLNEVRRCKMVIMGSHT